MHIETSGKVKVATGLTTQGQGHATVFAQLVADELGCRFEDVEVVTGDTRRMPYAVGTFASRAAVMSGSAIAPGGPAGARRRCSGSPRTRSRSMRRTCRSSTAWSRSRVRRVSSIDLGTVSVLSNPLRYAFDEASKAATQFSVGDPGKPPVAEDDEPGLEGRDFYSPERATFAGGDARGDHRDRPGDRRDHDPEVRRGARLRSPDQPDDRRGPDPRRGRPGRGRRPLRADGLRRERPAPERLVHGLPDALRHRGPGHASTSTTSRLRHPSTRSGSRAPARRG